MSLFISFEGGEGSGKSTQSSILLERLQRTGVSAILVREPGTTPLGQHLRDWLKREQREKTSHHAEALLFAAARAELVSKTIKPALKRSNTVVIADRYADSTTAYQGYGRRLSQRNIAVVNQLATQGVMPDLTLFLDCKPEYGLARLGSAQTPMLEGDTAGETQIPPDPPLRKGGTRAGRIDREGTKRFESEPIEFHQRVREGYLKLAEQEPARWCVIDATKSVDEISETVWDRVAARITLHPSREDSDTDLPLWAGSENSVDQGVD